MRTRPVPVGIKPLLLIGLGLFLYGRIASGAIFFYINERFIVLTLAAVLGLVLVGMSHPLRRGDPAHSDHSCGNHDHDHEHQHHTLSWRSVLVLALPIVLGMAVSPKPLGVAALETRELDMAGSGLPHALRQPDNVVASERNLLEWWQAFQLSSDSDALVGQDAEVTGFVYHDDRFGKDHFVVTRYVVNCCVADATVVGMVVRWPHTGQLANDQWVTVRGQIAGATQEEWHMPVLAANSVELTTAPRQPYLYP
jgi:putative membrane protein